MRRENEDLAELILNFLIGFVIVASIACFVIYGEKVHQTYFTTNHTDGD